jgi:DNA polymerase-3 subunit alpha
LGVELLPPCINASQAEFDVEATAKGGLAVRFALAALKSVGEGAMERLVEARTSDGPFKSLGDLANRVDPRLINKRQLETLAAGGAFDGLEPNRAGVHAVAETILAIAASAHHGRTSGQGGLFGEEAHGEEVIKLPANARWSLMEGMEQEKEAFGFYFSKHPVDRYRMLAKMHGARTFATLNELHIADGARVGATLAVLVEEARWRTSARGRRYLMATLSDATGQFAATCFEDSTSTDLEEAARIGGCGLLTVELDRRPGEETPRVSIKAIKPFETLAATTRFALEVAVSDAGAIPSLAALIGERRGQRGKVTLTVPVPDGGTARVLLGHDFSLDAELAERIEGIAGVASVSFEVEEVRLRSVG